MPATNGSRSLPVGIFLSNDIIFSHSRLGDLDKPFLLPVEDVFSISGRGTVATGRVSFQRMTSRACTDGNNRSSVVSATRATKLRFSDSVPRSSRC